jgi:hypothetical protein
MKKENVQNEDRCLARTAGVASRNPATLARSVSATLIPAASNDSYGSG